MLATKPYLTQADVQKILDAADKHAAENNWAVTIAVCDDGGHLLGLIRRDGCAPVSAYIAQEKLALLRWVNARAVFMKKLLITAAFLSYQLRTFRGCWKVGSISR